MRPGTTIVMGVVNVTADSFFGPSRAASTEAAVATAREAVAQGARIIDVGGESTRPGAQPVNEADELARVLPVLEALRGVCRLSVDTVKPAVARAAVAAGATLLNDVSGTLGPVAAELGVGWVSMHHRGIPARRDAEPLGPDGLAEVHDVTLGAARAAQALGVEEIYVDPGLGFGKDVSDNLRLVSHLDELCDAAHAEGFSVLVGASRKRFLGALPHGGPFDVDQRLEGSLAVAVFAMACGADVVRVHDVAATAQAAALVADDEEAA